MDDLYKTIGKNIKRLRQENDMTQKDLANELYVSHSTISHYESGARQIDTRTLTKIADLFSVSVNDMVKGLNKGTSDKEKNIRYLISTFDFTALGKRNDFYFFTGYMVFSVLSYLLALFMPFVILSFVYLVYSSLRFIRQIRRHHVFVPIYENEEKTMTQTPTNESLFWGEKVIIVLFLIMGFIVYPIGFDLVFEDSGVTLWFTLWFIFTFGLSIYILISEIIRYRPKQGISIENGSTYLGLFKYKVLHLIYLIPYVLFVLTLAYGDAVIIDTTLQHLVVILGLLINVMGYLLYHYEIKRKAGYHVH